MVNPTLAEIYARFPKLQCQGLCWDDCVPPSASDPERRRIRQFRESKQLPYREIGKLGLKDARQNKKDWIRTRNWCPYLNQDTHVCSIYEARPGICRLLGAVEFAKCQYGCKPDRIVTEVEFREILKALNAAPS